MVAIALSGALLGCGGPPKSFSTRATPSLEIQPEPPEAALRVLLTTKDRLAFDGSAFETMLGPAVVEAFPNGLVCTLGLEIEDAASDENLHLTRFEGALPEGVRAFPTRERGLGLYVEKQAELHLNAPDGPSVGVAHVGAYLPIIDWQGPWVRVALPDHHAPGLGTASGDPEPVSVFVEQKALTTTKHDVTLPRMSSELRLRDVTLHRSPGEPPFAESACLPLGISERHGDFTKVLVRSEGVDIVAFVHRNLEEVAARQASGNEGSCPGRLVVRERIVERRAPLEARIVTPPLPSGYAAVADDDSLRDPLGAVRRGERPLVWLSPGENGELECKEWRARGGEISHRFDDVISSFTFRYSPAIGDYGTPFVILEGPHTRTLDGRSAGIVLCGASYDIVRAESDRVWVVRGGRRHRYGIAGYNPADTEVWYFNRAACTSAHAPLLAARTASERVALAVHPHHGGC